jgi:predicted Zn-dependent protease
MMLTTFVWPEWIPAGFRTAGWVVLLGGWSWAVLVSSRRMPYLMGQRHRDGTEALFREAQTEYLKGNWYQAQSLLEQVLRQNASDVDAGLMLVSLNRHVRRVAEANEQLTRLRRLDLAGKWSLEIERESVLLERLETDTAPAAEQGTTKVWESHAA